MVAHPVFTSLQSLLLLHLTNLEEGKSGGGEKEVKKQSPVKSVMISNRESACYLPWDH